MATVTIDSIEAIPLSIPFDHWGPPPVFAGRPRTTMDALLIRVTASNGVVGWGEAFWGATATVVAALDERVSPLARGQDVNDAELTPRLERVLHNLGRAGPVIHAISGLDICSAAAGGSALRSTPRCCDTTARSSSCAATWRARSSAAIARSSCTSARRRPWRRHAR
jgi:L-alanine-DL-glutamate epimerase-like enolase superfamily enzyme